MNTSRIIARKPLSWLIAGLLVPAAASAQGVSSSSLVQLAWLEAQQTYDPVESEIPRRRPGHPLPRRWEVAPDINRGAISPPPADTTGEYIPVPDRWRIMETLGLTERWYDPYNQNTLKGDKPIHGEDWFLSLLAISDTVVEPRSVPTPTGPQGTERPGQNDIFSEVDQTIFNQNLIVGFVYYKGNTVYKPPDWEYRLTLAFNYNHVVTKDDRVLLIDPSQGRARTDKFVGVQELFIDKHLRDLTVRYDFDSIRVGIQPFSSDFRGFLFQDNQFGVRVFGNRDNNKWQYNLAWFRRLEKDTNSGLNKLDLRDDDVYIANLYRQDWPVLGFFVQGTVIHNRNSETDFFFDNNGFIARPASLGGERPRDYQVTYVGLSGDGHFGRFNLTSSAYYAHGRSSPGVFISDDSDIRAGFFAAEASIDYSWIRPRLSVLWASGDDDPFDDRSTGFDAIFENPIFAGADTSYWVRQNVPFVGGGLVTLAGRNGILNSLRSSKELGQSNFDNPGTRLVGFGADFDLTAQSRISVNVNQLWFDRTEVLEAARNQAPIRREIGQDVSVAWIYRPFMSQNLVFRLSAAGLNPGAGFRDLYGNDDIHYTVLANLVLAY